jgi:hypothetical protein
MARLRPGAASCRGQALGGVLPKAARRVELGAEGAGRRKPGSDPMASQGLGSSAGRWGADQPPEASCPIPRRRSELRDLCRPSGVRGRPLRRIGRMRRRRGRDAVGAGRLGLLGSHPVGGPQHSSSPAAFLRALWSRRARRIDPPRTSSCRGSKSGQRLPPPLFQSWCGTTGQLLALGVHPYHESCTHRCANQCFGRSLATFRQEMRSTCIRAYAAVTPAWAAQINAVRHATINGGPACQVVSCPVAASS